MVCPLCLQLGMAAANYELNTLVQHIGRRHPFEAILVAIFGTVLIIWAGPKIWRVVTS